MTEVETGNSDGKASGQSVIEYIKRVVPVAYLILVFWGLLYITVYYAFFGINIVNYVEISEILLVLYDDFLIAVLFAIAGVLMGIGLIKMPLDLVAVLIWMLRKKHVDLEPYFLYGVIALGMIALFISASFDLNKLNTFSAVLAAIAFAGSEQKVEPRVKTVFIGLFLLLTTFVIATTALQNARHTVKEFPRVNIVFEIPVTDVETMLVGETRNYLILYTRRDTSTMVINRDQVRYIKYLNKEDRLLKAVESIEHN